MGGCVLTYPSLDWAGGGGAVKGSGSWEEEEQEQEQAAAEQLWGGEG